MVVAGAIWSVASILSMTYGTFLNWPDYVHTDYGLPLTFAIHTANTIAGPVDRWNMDLTALVEDLVFWVLGMMVILIAFIYLQRRQGPKSSTEA